MEQAFHGEVNVEDEEYCPDELLVEDIHVLGACKWKVYEKVERIKVCKSYY